MVFAGAEVGQGKVNPPGDFRIAGEGIAGIGLIKKTFF